MVKILHHVLFDELAAGINSPSSNIASLRSSLTYFPLETEDLDAPNIFIRNYSFTYIERFALIIKCSHPTFGVECKQCLEKNRPFISSIATYSKISSKGSFHKKKSSYIIMVNDILVNSQMYFLNACWKVSLDNSKHVELVISPEKYINFKLMSDGLPLMQQDHLWAVIRTLVEIG